MAERTVYEPTAAAFIFESMYDRETATYQDEAFEQMLTVFEDGMSLEDAKYCFEAPVAEQPLNDKQLETRALFDYIVVNFDYLIAQLLARDFIKVAPT